MRLHNFVDTSYKSFDSGMLHNLYYSDMYNVSASYLNFVVLLPIKIIEVAMILTIVLFINAKLTLLALLSIPLYVLFVVLNSRKRSALNEDCIKTNDELVKTINNFKDNISSIKMTHKEEFFDEKLQKKLEENFLTHQKYHFWFLLGEKIPYFIQLATPIIIIWLGAHNVRENLISLGTLIMFSQFIGKLFEPITDVFFILTQNKSMKPFYERYNCYFNLLSNQELDVFEDSTNFLNVKQAKIMNKKQEELFNVSDLQVYDNGVYLIKGANGSGKSTLLSLIAGQLSKEQVEGDFSVSSDYIKNISLLAYPKFVFDGSLSENIFLDDQADLKLVDRYFKNNISDKMIISNPINLSSGETQKIELLRIMHEDRSCILLDEPTTNLESEAKTLLKQDIQRASKNKIIIIVDHENTFDDMAKQIYEIRDRKLIKTL